MGNNRCFSYTKETHTMSGKKTYSAGQLAALQVCAVPVGALVGGVNGIVGKFSLSFFNPSLASAAGTLGTFADVGALSFSFFFIPHLLKEHYFDNSGVLEEEPILKAILKDITGLFLQVSSVVLAALILGLPPLGATVIASVILPLTTSLLSGFFKLTAHCLNDTKSETPAEEGLNFTGNFLR